MRFQPDSTNQPTPHAPLNAQVQRYGANVHPRRPVGKAAATTLVCMGRPQKKGAGREIGSSRCGQAYVAMNSSTRPAASNNSCMRLITSRYCEAARKALS
jgi:hypothetical protein